MPMKGETRPRARMHVGDSYAFIRTARKFSALTAIERNQVLRTYTRLHALNPNSAHTRAVQDYIVQDGAIHEGRAVRRARA